MPEEGTFLVHGPVEKVGERGEPLPIPEPEGHPGYHSLDAGMLVEGESPRPATQVAEEDQSRGPSISPRAIPVSPLGAPCWSGQNWPYGKPITVLHAIGGGIRNAWGDYTIQSGGAAPLGADIDIERVNEERQALCMPLIRQEVY